jgi:hypothetical protein
MVVPETKGHKRCIQLRQRVDLPVIEFRFQSTEESLDPAVHPGAPFHCSLLFDAQEERDTQDLLTTHV